MEKVLVDIVVMELVFYGGCGVYVVVILLEIQWYDVGFYEVLVFYLFSDGMGNNVSGLMVLVDLVGNLLINDCFDVVLVVVGLYDMVVVSIDCVIFVVLMF